MNLNDLPPMREAFLSIDQVASLFQDIQDLATDVQLMQRRLSSNGNPQISTSNRAADRATALNAQLSTARELLWTRQIPRLQIRYAWSDASWIDTLETQSDGSFRLVRIQHG